MTRRQYRKTRMETQENTSMNAHGYFFRSEKGHERRPEHATNDRINEVDKSSKQNIGR